MGPKAPCKDCQFRTLTCHIKGNCDAWDAYEVEHQKYYQAMQRERNLNYSMKQSAARRRSKK